jgi:hypothetical protein
LPFGRTMRKLAGMSIFVEDCSKMDVEQDEGEFLTPRPSLTLKTKAACFLLPVSRAAYHVRLCTSQLLSCNSHVLTSYHERGCGVANS